MIEPSQSSNDAKPPAFSVGGENLLAKVDPGDAGAVAAALDEIRIRIGTLLKTETVSFLLGAGASVDCGGQLIGNVPLTLEKALHDQGISGTERPRIRRWLMVFYSAVYSAGGGQRVPTGRDGILERRQQLDTGGIEPLPVNFERVLAQLHRWRAALPEAGGQLRVDGGGRVQVTAGDLDAAIVHATRALADACRLPREDKREGLQTYNRFVRKLLTRPLNLKRVNIFTLNYDTLVEQAADAESVVLLDGFVGTQQRIFRPECYEQDLYFPAETTEGRVHRFDRVLHLYRLHGSIAWVASEASIENPFGVSAADVAAADDGKQLLVYPTPLKYGETLGIPYAELFRRFAAAIVRPQSVLFSIGYGFGDEHVNAIIRQALGVPSFTLIIVDPRPTNAFVDRLREQKDQRIWVAEGDLGKFAGFVDRVLPDLREEDVRRKVIDTQRALTRNAGNAEGKGDADG